MLEVLEWTARHPWLTILFLLFLSGMWRKAVIGAVVLGGGVRGHSAVSDPPRPRGPIANPDNQGKA